MQALIEFPILREMNIIQTLVMDDKSLNNDEIAKLNNCSIATAKNDVTSIVKKYTDIFGALANDGELYFTNKNLANVTQTLRDLFSESLRIQLIIEIFDVPYQSRQHYCKATAISEASFYRAIKSINKVFLDYGFLIAFQNGGYYLKTKRENELRRFIVSMMIETKTIEESFIRIPFETMKEVVAENILDSLPLDFELYYNYYTYFTYVSMIRETQGFGKKRKVMSIDYPEFPLLKSYFPDLEEGHLYSIRKDFLDQIEPWKDLDEKNEVLNAFVLFIEDFATYSGKICDDKLRKQLLFICVLTYGNFEIYPADYKILFNRVDDFISQFKKSDLKTYIDFNAILIKATGGLNQSIDHMSDQLLFWIQLLCPELYIKKVDAKVKIYSDLGKEHQDFYKTIFSTLLSNLTILNDDDPQTPDFIIANYFLKKSETPVLFIRDYPMHEDILKIYSKMG